MIDHNIVAHSQNPSGAANGYNPADMIVGFTGSATPTVGTALSPTGGPYQDSNYPSIFQENFQVNLSAAGSYPTPLASGTTYYMRNFSTTNGTFNLSLTPGPSGALINTTDNLGVCGSSPNTNDCFISQVSSTYTYTNNVGCDWSNPMFVNDAVNVTQSGNTFQNTSCSGFPDSSRTVGGYYASIGNPGGQPSTTQGYINAVLTLNKDNWIPSLLAVNVNCYIQAGFGFGCPGGG